MLFEYITASASFTDDNLRAHTHQQTSEVRKPNKIEFLDKQE